MIAALRSWIRSLLGRTRAVERPSATVLTEGQMLSLSLVSAAGEYGWQVDAGADELALVGSCVVAEEWQRLRQWEALERTLPYLGSDPEPPPHLPLDRLDLLTAVVRLGWSDLAPEAGCHGGTGEEV
jgi:hypothetical protein